MIVAQARRIQIDITPLETAGLFDVDIHTSAEDYSESSVDMGTITRAVKYATLRAIATLD